MAGTNLQMNAAMPAPAPVSQKLSDSQQRVVDVLIDPRYFKASVADQAKAAGLSRPQFYRVRKEEAVLAAVRDAMGERIILRLPRVIDAMLKSAMIPGKEGAGDRKLLVEMTGLYSRYGPRAPAPSTPEDQGKQFADGLVKALNEARARSAEAKGEMAQSQVEGFDQTMEILEGDWQDEATTSGDDDLESEAEIT